MGVLQYIPNIITISFLLVILSYYIIFFLIRPKKSIRDRRFSSITVIIPAHNEEAHIRECIDSVLSAGFKGKKEVFVVDDGSTDNTRQAVTAFGTAVRLISKPHTGKSDSITSALEKAESDLIAVVDADSIIGKNALVELTRVVEHKGIAAATGVIKVKNRRNFLCMWLHIDLLFGALMRLGFSKINASIVTPGPLSVYRKKELQEAGGFSRFGLSEDVDVTIRLIRKGYEIGFSEKATAETYMPSDIKGFVRQQARFRKGAIDILKRHLGMRQTVIDFYTLPLLLFNYVQGVIMGAFTLYQVFAGYFQYFVAYNVYFSFGVARFFFEWFSFYGYLKWIIATVTGQAPWTVITIIGIISSALSYPLYFYSVLRFDKKFDIWHIIPLFFMAPFWIVTMTISLLCLPESLKREQINIWKKNE